MYCLSGACTLMPNLCSFLIGRKRRWSLLFWAECELVLKASTHFAEMADAMNVDFEQISGASKSTPALKSRAKLLKRLKSDTAQSDRQRFFLKSKDWFTIVLWHATVLLRISSGQPQIRPSFESETWQLLENAIDAVQTGVPVPESLELLYQVRYDPNDLCVFLWP